MYLVLKLLHIFAVIVFVGNIIVGIFWKTFGDLTKDPRIIVHTMRGILRADRWFTMPGVLLLLIFGIGAAQVGHIPILRTGWILWSIVMLIISGLAFGPLSRVQRQIAGLSDSPDAFDSERYEALSKAWNAWGALALITPIIAIVLMVLKPSIPAL